ncbi:alpha/beta fold hydrolase [Macrococcus lamae]|uniref:Alpha/beta hydrolase n=1 Tax=Macrococcus lamae TaxID=198484 RepID=A0A4R6BW51_9STAP|nr:alpha/beta hydrolase [Macrococcus lamae]TDM12250.1 alpha/beta hydrolase [Macrococcus lamae]
MFIEIDGYPVYYETIGKGVPVLCIHGYGVDHRIMKNTVESVIKETDYAYSRIYIDLPGMGQSAVNPNIINADDMLSVLMKFIRKVIKKQHFLIIGNSYGGYLSNGINFKMAGCVDGMFFFCPVIIADSEKRKLPVHQHILLETINPGDHKKEFQEFLNTNVIITKKNWQRYLDELVTGKAVADTDFKERYFNDGYSFSFERELLETRHNCPMTVIVGRQDSTVGYDDAYNLVKDNEFGNFILLNEAGHNLQIDQAKLFNAHLLHFFKIHQ